jgi:high-affinity nickel-transport protein
MARQPNVALVNVALLLSSLGLGLRHGVDWDHISAITDITGTEYEKRRAAWLACLYALGHGAAVMVLGSLAIVAGDRLPTWIDAVMERGVGLTLLVLAVLLVRSAFKGRSASRGMLLFQGLKRVRERVRRTQRVEIEHAHAERDAAVVTTHVHAVDVTRYTVSGAVMVGLLHGIGAETGTQALVLVSASRIASPAAGVAVLAAFVLGIVVTTGAMAITTAFGWHVMSSRGRAYKIVTLASAAASGVIGLLYLT